MKEKKALQFIKVQSGEISGKLKNFLRDIFFSSLEKLRKEKKTKDWGIEKKKSSRINIKFFREEKSSLGNVNCRFLQSWTKIFGSIFGRNWIDFMATARQREKFILTSFSIKRFQAEPLVCTGNNEKKEIVILIFGSRFSIENISETFRIFSLTALQKCDIPNFKKSSFYRRNNRFNLIINSKNILSLPLLLIGELIN